MSYDLKKENRKKFQDKTKLKRHHKKNYAKVVPKEPEKSDDVTPEGQNQPETRSRSNSGTEVDENTTDGTVAQTPSNIWRYQEEISIHGIDDQEVDVMKEIDFKKLYLNKEIDLPGRRKTKDEELDDLIKKASIRDEKQVQEYEYEEPKTRNLKKDNELAKSTVSQLKKTSDWKNDTPEHLKEDEDFLDSLI